MSCYPVTGAVLAVPIYLPAVLRGEAPESPVWEDLEKTSAAVIVALSAVFLYLALLRLTTLRMALLVTGAYAFGTSSLSVSSQALWQHGPSQLGLAAALYFLVKGREAERWVAVSGFPLAFAVISRPTDLLLAVPLGLYVLLYYPKQVGRLLVFALPPLAFQLWYNATYQGSAFWTQAPILQGEHWTGRFWEGFSGLLFSPGRGLFVYSPIFLFSLVALAMAWRRAGILYFAPLAWGRCSSCSCTAGGGLGGVDTPSGRDSWPTSLPCSRWPSIHFARIEPQPVDQSRLRRRAPLVRRNALDRRFLG